MNARQKARRNESIETARANYLAQQEREHPRNDSDNAIMHVSEIPKDALVHAACRVSNRNQTTNQRLERDKKSMTKWLNSNNRRFTSISAFQEKANNGTNRGEFEKVLKQANKENAKFVLFKTPTRLLRHALFHPFKNQHVVPAKKDWEKLAKCVKQKYDITLAVISPLNLTNEEDRAFIVKMEKTHNQNRTNSKGGRPKKTGRKKTTARDKRQAQIERHMDIILRTDWSTRKTSEFLHRNARLKISHNEIAKIRKNAGKCA